jgi:uncharacterized LabA/DUF88 family protein
VGAARAAFYVDGFNLYHSLKSSSRSTACRWLDVRSLCQAFLSRREKLERVLYFTALTTWDRPKVERHTKLITALEATGVEIVMGKFKQKQRLCTACGQRYLSVEEKETDVNIAVRLIRDAVRDEFDTAFLMTGDSDLIPALRIMRELFPGKDLVVVFPFNRVTEALKREASRYMRVRLHHLEAHRFAKVVRTRDGRQIACPDSWL